VTAGPAQSPGTGRRRARALRVKLRAARACACLAAGVVALAAMTGCTAQPGAGEQPPVPNWKDPGGVAVASAAAAHPFAVCGRRELCRNRRRCSESRQACRPR